MRTLLFALLVATGCGGSSAPDDGGAADMTMAGDSGLLPLGASGCTANTDCQSNLCASYQMGAVKRCSLACTSGQPAPQCVAPGDGTCNGMGFCKFPM